MNPIERFRRWRESREINSMFRKAGQFTGEGIAMIHETNPTLAQIVFLKTREIMNEPITAETDWPVMRDRLERELNVVMDALEQEYKRLGYGEMPPRPSLQ